MQPDRTGHTPLRVDLGCDDCVSAGLVDEWLQARNALSIEIFLQHTPFGRSPVFCARRLRQLRHQGGIEPTAASVRRPAFVDRPNDRHPAIDAEDVHGDSAHLVTS